MSTPTTNLGLTKPAVNDPLDADAWGTKLNTDLDIIDSEFATKTIDQDFNSKRLKRPVLERYTEKLNAAGNISGSVTVDFSLGNHYSATLIGNVTFSFINLPATGQVVDILMFLYQDGTGSRTAAFPAAVVNAPTLTTTASKLDIFSLMTIDGGSTIYLVGARQGL